jgi:hypothetical protein
MTEKEDPYVRPPAWVFDTAHFILASRYSRLQEQMREHGEDIGKLWELRRSQLDRLIASEVSDDDIPPPVKRRWLRRKAI